MPIKFLQDEAVLQPDLNKALHRALDFLTVLTCLGLGIALMRSAQLGSNMFFWNVVILIAGVTGGVFLRKEKHLIFRGLFLISIHLVAISYGIVQLGLLTPGFYALPFFIALSASFLNRAAITGLLSGTVGLLILVAFQHVAGNLSSPNLALSDWNANPRNWIVAIVTVAITSVLMILLVRSLTKFWREADSKAVISDQQLDAIVAFAPDAIMIADIEADQVLSVNPQVEKLLGIAPGEITNLENFMKFSPDQQPSGELSIDLAWKYTNEVLLCGHKTFDWVHKKSNGELVSCEVSSSRIPPFDRKIIRSSARDLTQRLAEQKQREELQEQLAASQRRETIGHLTGGFAHDFNNLLAVILGNLELYQEEGEEGDEEKRKEMIQTSFDAALHGAELTRSMLAFARQAPLQPKVVSLNKIILATKKWSGPSVPANIEIETSLLARLWKVKADPTSTESALLNLILNARDAMPDGGKLTIETSNVRIEDPYLDGRNEKIEPGRYVLIGISDTGMGIPKDDVDRIFDPFYTSKPTGQGTGLGLAMVLGFMRQSGGTVQVYSEIGVGTTFKLYFPAITDGSEQLIIDQADNLPSVEPGQRILLVEDVEGVLVVLKKMLVSAGYDVTAVDNGDKAKKVFDSDSGYDLLLTDIVMPGLLQGTTLAKELRKINEKLPVVFMSGYASEATVHGNGLRPEDTRLMKPVRRADLLAAVSQAISRARVGAGSP